MNTRLVVSIAALALAGGCKKKESKTEAAPATGSGASAELGSGSPQAGTAVAEAPKPDPKLVERGAYLTSLLGCPFCHMPMGPKGPDFARAFAGGMEIPEKFGTWRAPNITPHKGSGIGGWTDEQIIAAVREGVRPDGSKLFPVMPYLNYNRMTDDDAKALVAFLRTVPPIDNVVAPNKDLKIPQIPAPKPTNEPDVTTDPLKHGEYLVTLMHCNMCHTAPGKDGAPDMTKQYAGGMEMEMPPLGTGVLVTANITSDPETGIGTWSLEDVKKSMRALTRPDGSIIQGPMQFYLAGWSKMDDADLTSVATYVKGIPAVKNKVAKSTFKPHMGPPPGAPDGAGSAAGSGSAAAGSAAGAAAGSGDKK
jgi:hypothetical protein